MTVGNPEGGTEDWTKTVQLNISTFSYFFLSLFSCFLMFFVLISTENSLVALFYKDEKVLKMAENTILKTDIPQPFKNSDKARMNGRVVKIQKNVILKYEP